MHARMYGVSSSLLEIPLKKDQTKQQLTNNKMEIRTRKRKNERKGQGNNRKGKRRKCKRQKRKGETGKRGGKGTGGKVKRGKRQFSITILLY